ncbi:SRPBCC domain-containing protein [bacterium]|nr:MAG: SRPBCC domain-containing protein [bacterium]
MPNALRSRHHLPMSVLARASRGYLAFSDTVFDAFLDPEMVKRWFAPGLGEIQSIEIDPRVGGKFTFVDRRDGEDIAHVGEYLEIDRPNRLAFTWSIPQSSDDVSKVTIEITPQSEGCDVTLVHEIAPEWAMYRKEVAQSWKKMLDALARAMDPPVVDEEEEAEEE